jgi:hypothetical protein
MNCSCADQRSAPRTRTSFVSWARKCQSERNARNPSAGSAVQRRTSSSSAAGSCSVSSAAGTSTVVRSPSSRGNRFCSREARRASARSGVLMNATRRWVALSTRRLPSTAGAGAADVSIQSQLSSAATSCTTSLSAARTWTGPSDITPCPCTIARNHSSFIQRAIVRLLTPAARAVSAYDLPSRIMRAARARLYAEVRG